MGKRLKEINWKSYNKELIRRGSITFWFSDDVVDSWYSASTGRGFQKIYSDSAIEILSMIRFRFHLTLRSTQSFFESLVQLMSLSFQVPDYSTLSRRLDKCDVHLGKLKCSEPVHVVIDRTGLKVFGEGEWKVRQHGYSKRRTWTKLHLCVDEGNQQIISTSLTENSFKDNEVFEDLLYDLENHVGQASANRAYDTKNCWDFCEYNDIKGTFPPKKGALLNNMATVRRILFKGTSILGTFVILGRKCGSKTVVILEGLWRKRLCIALKPF